MTSPVNKVDQNPNLSSLSPTTQSKSKSDQKISSAAAPIVASASEPAEPSNSPKVVQAALKSEIDLSHQEKLIRDHLARRVVSRSGVETPSNSPGVVSATLGGKNESKITFFNFPKQS